MAGDDGYLYNGKICVGIMKLEIFGVIFLHYRLDKF